MVTAATPIEYVSVAPSGDHDTPCIGPPSCASVISPPPLSVATISSEVSLPAPPSPWAWSGVTAGGPPRPPRPLRPPRPPPPVEFTKARRLPSGDQLTDPTFPSGSAICCSAFVANEWTNRSIRRRRSRREMNATRVPSGDSVKQPRARLTATLRVVRPPLTGTAINPPPR